MAIKLTNCGAPAVRANPAGPLLALLLLALAPATTIAQAGPAPADLFGDLPGAVDAGSQNDPAVVRSRVVRADFALLHDLRDGRKDRVGLNLFGDVRFLSRIDARRSGTPGQPAFPASQSTTGRCHHHSPSPASARPG